MKKLIIATNNDGKLKEIKKIFSSAPYEILSLKDIGLKVDIIEDKDTFEGNAMKKAYEVMKLTGQPALADDSGLEVDALNGKPGVFSARFAGENATAQDNNNKLITMLKNTPVDERKACFKCSMVIAFPDGKMLKSEGICKGSISFEARGTGGFGYDPYFIVDNIGKTFAELSDEEKNKISHRGIALKKIKELLSKNEIR